MSKQKITTKVFLVVALLGAGTSCRSTSDPSVGAIFGLLGNGHIATIIASGAVAGACSPGNLVGFAAGDNVKHKKAAFKSHEDWLDACRLQAEKINRNAARYNHALNSKIARLNGEIDDAKSGGDRGKLGKINSAVHALQGETKQVVKRVDAEIKEQGSVVQQTGSSELNAKLSELRITRSALIKAEDTLAETKRAAFEQDVWNSHGDQFRPRTERAAASTVPDPKELKNNSF